MNRRRPLKPLEEQVGVCQKATNMLLRIFWIYCSSQLVLAQQTAFNSNEKVMKRISQLKFHPARPLVHTDLVIAVSNHYQKILCSWQVNRFYGTAFLT